MFTNLIESGSHRKELLRKTHFVLLSGLVYLIVIPAVLLAGAWTYRPVVEEQTTQILQLPPIMKKEVPVTVKQVYVPKTGNTGGSIGSGTTISKPTISKPVISSTSDPTHVPQTIGNQASKLPAESKYRGTGKIDLPEFGTGTGTGTDSCIVCSNGNGTVSIPENVPVPTPKPTLVPTPTPVKIQRVTSSVLTSKVLSLPSPIYPAIAKQIHAEGSVIVRIRVDETGKVTSASVVSGNPMLSFSARNAALQARFTPTILNGVPVKLEGEITYNFKLQ